MIFQTVLICHPVEQSSFEANIKLSTLATLQTVTLDGGEFRSLAGEFNGLRQVPEEMWDMMEKMIRGSNKKEKSKL